MCALNQLLNNEYTDVQEKGLELLYNFLILSTTPLLLFIDNPSSLLSILPHLLSCNAFIQRQAYNVIKV